MKLSRKTPIQWEPQFQASSLVGFQESYYQGQEQALTLLSIQYLCLC